MLLTYYSLRETSARPRSESGHCCGRMLTVQEGRVKKGLAHSSFENTLRIPKKVDLNKRQVKSVLRMSSRGQNQKL